MASRSTCRDVTNTGACGSAGVKTPGASDRSRSLVKKATKTPGSASRSQSVKTPGKNASRSNPALTPSRNASFVAPNQNKTPGGGDRHIPNRCGSNFDLAHYLAINESQNSSQSFSQSQVEYQRQVSEALNGGATGPRDSADQDKFRIFAFGQAAPAAPLGFTNSQKVLYSARATPASSCKKGMRHIPNQPERILDAPGIGDDFYLNVLDWSSTSFLAVALNNQLYVWHSETGSITSLVELEESSQQYLSSVSWAKEGQYLAVGLSTGVIQLWDTGSERLLRTMSGHADQDRVGSLSWNDHLLSSGCRSGTILHNDVRVAEHVVGTLRGHTQEVCGLRWSPSGRYLASGGNDNMLNIWSDVQGDSNQAPLFSLTDHQAAVKGLSWCPWQPAILASGGGTADRCIRLWNCNTGTCLSTTDTESQVSSILWSEHHKELISGHGYPNNELSIWKYPDMAKIGELTGHTSRILQLALSPDREMVVSASADESIRIWHCFAVDPASKKKAGKGKAHGPAGGRPPISGTLAKTLR